MKNGDEWRKLILHPERGPYVSPQSIDVLQLPEETEIRFGVVNLLRLDSTAEDFVVNGSDSNVQFDITPRRLYAAIQEHPCGSPSELPGRGVRWRSYSWGD